MQLTRSSGENKWQDIEPSYEPVFGVKIRYRKIITNTFWYLIFTDLARIFLDLVLAWQSEYGYVRRLFGFCFLDFRKLNCKILNLFSNSSDLFLKLRIFIKPSHNSLVPLLTNRTMKTKQHTQKIKNLITTQSVLMSNMNSLITNVKI